MLSSNSWANDEIVGDPSNGKDLYQICASCHGENSEGNQSANAPRLAGQYDWYLVT